MSEGRVLCASCKRKKLARPEWPQRPAMNFLVSHYDVGGVLASIAIACTASYVSLDLVQRVRGAGWAWNWWLGGSLVMGSGIWSMHFVGMLAFTLPIEIGYTIGMTFLSWLAAVLASGVALGLAGRGLLGKRWLAGGSVAMATGICGMHYIGMAAMELAPGIVWHWPLVGASIGVALAAAFVALAIIARLQAARGERGRGYRVGAALALGAAVSGMHYTAMAAAQFPLGAVCLSADELGGGGLGSVVALGTFVIFTMSFLDSRMRRRTQSLAGTLQRANRKLQSANDELRKHAFQDPLTGLPNRLLFEDRLAHAVLRTERKLANEHVKIAVIFVDLDSFKPVNDSFGHAAGDALLCEAAWRLQDEARDADSVARIGGDEFLVLVEDIDDAEGAASLAKRLAAALSRPFAVAGNEVHISASIGVSLYPDNGPPDKLIARADAAMYAAKRNGGGSYVLFEPHMDAGALEQMSLQSDLRRALDGHQLELYYQPKVDARRGRITGVEALARWNHPERGVLSPGIFIPLAERFGLISRLGDWVIEEACRQLRSWADVGVRMRVSVNVSAYQLRDEKLARQVERMLQQYAIDPDQFLVEITESTAMEDLRTTQRTFDSLARIGVFLSIDDFGTGYSSLSYLRQLPARQLKIDRSFIKDLEASADARAVVAAVVSLAHALELRVVAEGVETQAQGEILTTMGCDELQGYYFAHPMPAPMLLQWVKGEMPAGSAAFSPSIMGSL